MLKMQNLAQVQNGRLAPPIGHNFVKTCKCVLFSNEAAKSTRFDRERGRICNIEPNVRTIWFFAARY